MSRPALYLLAVSAACVILGEAALVAAWGNPDSDLASLLASAAGWPWLLAALLGARVWYRGKGRSSEPFEHFLATYAAGTGAAILAGAAILIVAGWEFPVLPARVSRSNRSARSSRPWPWPPFSPASRSASSSPLCSRSPRQRSAPSHSRAVRLPGDTSPRASPLPRPAGFSRPPAAWFSHTPNRGVRTPSTEQPNDRDHGSDQNARLKEQGTVEITARHQLPRLQVWRQAPRPV